MSELEINCVLLSGCIACEPELRDLPNDEPVCWLRLACVVGGACSSRPGYFDAIVLGPLVPCVAPYVRKGRRVLVRGGLESARWEAGEGPEREAVCVLAERVYFVGDNPQC